MCRRFEQALLSLASVANATAALDPQGVKDFPGNFSYRCLYFNSSYVETPLFAVQQMPGTWVRSRPEPGSTCLLLAACLLVFARRCAWSRCCLLRCLHACSLSRVLGWRRITSAISTAGCAPTSSAHATAPTMSRSTSASNTRTSATRESCGTTRCRCSGRTSRSTRQAARIRGRATGASSSPAVRRPWLLMSRARCSCVKNVRRLCTAA